MSRQPAHDRERPPAQLGLCQLGRSRDLVGDGRGGDGQLVAVRIELTREGLQRQQSGRADGHVGLSLAPRPAQRVGHDHRDVHPAPGQGRPQSACGRVGIQG